MKNAASRPGHDSIKRENDRARIMDDANEQVASGE
jgi:hypothetical protein